MPGNSLSVTETFASIQGESTHAGRPCFFIRLAGCNLDCHYCDTLYSKHPDQGDIMSIEDLVRTALNSRIGLIEITGGEPLIQKNTFILARKLIQHDLTVLIETNGSLPINNLPDKVIRIMDCKTPSSGMADRTLFSNFTHITTRDEVKFVIADRQDFDYSRRVIEKYQLLGKTGNLLFCPAWNELSPITLAEWIIQEKLEVRMQLQLHKLIWSPEQRGV